MTILEHYFYLSDLAVTDKRSLQKLCCLFKDDAIIEANDGHRYSGRREIDSFFTEFFSRNAETRHMISENYRILFNRPTGELFAEEKMEHILP